MSFAWSYSRLKNYETCGLRHYHYDVIKDIQEEESGALREGNELHKAFELRVKDGVKLPLPFARHETVLAQLCAEPGETYSEQKLALNRDFQPTGFFSGDVWFRTVIDFCKVRGAEAFVIDYKSGRIADDETQLALMAATIMHHDAAIAAVQSAFLFVNHGKLVPKAFTRDDLARIWANVLPRVQKLEAAAAADDYQPRPSGLCVKYCGVVSCQFHGTGSAGFHG